MSNTRSRHQGATVTKRRSPFSNAVMPHARISNESPERQKKIACRKREENGATAYGQVLQLSSSFSAIEQLPERETGFGRQRCDLASQLPKSLLQPTQSQTLWLRVW